MPSPTRMPRGRGALGRRVLLLGALGSGGLALAACGIHLEDDAPDVPLVPRRTPIGAETQLLALLANSRELAAACANWTTEPQVALAPSLAAIHRQQADVLAALLADAHVPAGLVAGATPTPAPTLTTSTATDSAATPSNGATTTPTTTTAPTTSADIAALERAPLAGAAELSAAPAPLTPTVAAILAQRYAAASLVGGAAPVVGSGGAAGPQATGGATGSPTGSGAAPTTATTSAPTPPAGGWVHDDLVAVLDATRSATYGFEVVAAQGDPAGRALGVRTLATLAAMQATQEGALTSPAPPAALGYPLPFPVTTPALARKLGGQLAVGLRAAYGSALDAAAEGADPFLDLVSWLGQVEVVVRDWGGALAPFPGMTTP